MTICKVVTKPMTIDTLVLPKSEPITEKTEKTLTETKERRTMKAKNTKSNVKKTAKKSKAKLSKSGISGKKLCRDCKKSKTLDAFCTNNACPDGKHSRCKVCEQEYRTTLAATSTKKKTVKKVAKKKVTKRTAKKK